MCEAVGRLAGWCWKSPGEVGDELRGYFVSAQPEAAGAGHDHDRVVRDQVFFEQALKRDWTAMDIPVPGRSTSCPSCCREEVWRILGEVRDATGPA